MHKALIWIGAVLLGTVALVLLVLALIDWNALRGPLSRYASARLGRTVQIAGALEVHPWSRRPRIEIHGLTIANAPWDKHEPMARVELLSAELDLLPLLRGDVILPRVVMEKPEAYLHRDASGRANWSLRGDGKSEPAQAPQLPVVRDFVIDSGKLQVVDDMRRLNFHGTVQAEEKASRADASAFRIEGDGVLNGRPFKSRVSGGPLINLDPDQPYPFKLVLKAGDTAVDADGVVPKPFDLGTLEATVRASGNDLADLYYLTGLALPNTPPYELTAAIRRDGSRVHLSRIDGTLGRSDLHGALDVDLSGRRPNVTGKLGSKALDAENIVAALGARKGSAAEAAMRGASEAKTAAPASAPADATTRSDEAEPDDAHSRELLFPEARLQVNRVRAMDADISYTADVLTAGSLSTRQVAARIRLDGGILSMDPLSLELPQGRLSGTVKIDARKDVPHTQADLLLDDADLGQLKNVSGSDAAPFAGPIHARIQVEGAGASMHEFVSHAGGSLTAVVPHGEIRASLAELTGIDVVRALGLLLANDQQRMPIRCGVASFHVEDGVMRAQQIVFDTTSILITGKGEVRLASEEVELAVQGDPKEPRIARVRSPVEIKGTLRRPVIGIDAGKAAGQVSVAAALAVVATPLAAILAFVDPGLADDADCVALMAEAASDEAGSDNVSGE